MTLNLDYALSSLLLAIKFILLRKSRGKSTWLKKKCAMNAKVYWTLRWCMALRLGSLILGIPDVIKTTIYTLLIFIGMLNIVGKGFCQSKGCSRQHHTQVGRVEATINGCGRTVGVL